jgi:hypothetical protein
VSEIEFWAPYVVDGRSLFACILRFEDAKTDYSDTLSGCALSPPCPFPRNFRCRESKSECSACPARLKSDRTTSARAAVVRSTRGVTCVDPRLTMRLNRWLATPTATGLRPKITTRQCQLMKRSLSAMRNWPAMDSPRNAILAISENFVDGVWCETVTKEAWAAVAEESLIAEHRSIIVRRSPLAHLRDDDHLRFGP